MVKLGKLEAVATMVTVVLILCIPCAIAADNDCTVQGVVKNSSGKPVSGAYVKLKNAERRFTFMVVSQARGVYSAANLPSGSYTVQGIGNGFQSEWSKVEVAHGKSTKLDLSLTARQGPALEPAWPTGYVTTTYGVKPMPLPEGDGKEIIATRCVSCHNNARIILTRMDQENWQHTVTEMRENMKSGGQRDLTDQEADVVTKYLATNFPAVPAPDPGSRLSRTLLKGQEASYRAVQFAIPTPYAEAHDVSVDPQGYGWVDQRSGGRLGRLDPNTLEYTEVSPPGGKVRMQNIEIDPQGRTWFIERARNGRWFSYDTKTGEWGVYSLPQGLARDTTNKHIEMAFEGDDAYEGGANQIVKLNVKTKEFSVFDVPSWVKTRKDVGIYGIAVAGDGRVWFAEARAGAMGRLDPKTGEINEFEIPIDPATLPNIGGVPSLGPFPRRMGTDASGNIWVGVWGAGKLMKVDQKTGEMTLYDPPTKNAGAYYVSVDKKNDLVWVGLQMADKLDRFNPKTGEWLEFSLPEVDTDVRKIEVDQNNPNRIWWTQDLGNPDRVGFIEILGH
jgi:virginiamycin B lyase